MTYDAADGYIVLFGGHGPEDTSLGSHGVGYCYNDTWIFQNGQWMELMVPGPPNNCDPSLVYDAADGYVLETMGASWEADCGGCQVDINQTWAFSHGQWRELNILDPPATDGYMAYDPQIGAALLCGTHQNLTTGFLSDQDWEFHGGLWSQIHPAAGQRDCATFVDLSYDAAMGAVIAINVTQVAETWTYSNGTWSKGPNFPMLFAGDGALAFDPKDNYSVFFGVVSPYGQPRTELLNVTLLYETGQWVNASIPGPPERGGEGLAYDAHDGYLMLFGGCGAGPPNNLTACLLNDTWIYSPPPSVVHLSVSASPTGICSAASADCGVGTDITRVTLSLTALPSNATGTIGVDSGAGTIDWGPYYWLDDPTLEFAGWKNLIPATLLDPASLCIRGATGQAFPCNTPTPNITAPGTDNELLSWQWGLPGPTNALEVGDTWNVSFNEVATGPPFGSVPVDACSTPRCASFGDTAALPAASGLSFSPYGNSSRWTLSAPLGLVQVLPPLSTPTPISSSPPPPPPPIGTPQPVGIPVAPAPVLTPAPTTGAGVPQAAFGSSLSGAAAVAGILGAAAARTVIGGRNPKRVAHALLTGRRRHQKRTVRGSD